MVNGDNDLVIRWPWSSPPGFMGAFCSIIGLAPHHWINTRWGVSICPLPRWAVVICLLQVTARRATHRRVSGRNVTQRGPDFR